ncbi:hypothetical protein GCM10010193_54210 [Kitasatospora atroaurantiaca]|uniref:Uncharacterized protein n=1 Tax=Kitasatospora atroaurantiaca TaxID=285545 RepID=A0A561EQ11_9ACTN|nr:hypothetical protein [Kitasatospora atroaurantiaca]TWE17690.1 hypothetical protein FB465_2728 [Kitasatospora atroaurantiaca]
MNVRRTAAGAALLAAALTAVTGCGIRPTAVPVDAGAPASRTACPSPVRVPAAVLTPTPSPSVAPSTSASVPAPVASSKAPQGLFSATPSPTGSRCP